MAGIGFRLAGTVDMATAELSKVAVVIIPTVNRRILIRELSVTASDPNKNGGFLIVKLGTIDAGSVTGYLTLSVIAEDPAFQSYIACAAYGWQIGCSEPSMDNLLERKRINVNGGEFLWTAIREDNKLPISGGDSVGTDLYSLGLFLETDTVANEVSVDYTFYGES